MATPSSSAHASTTDQADDPTLRPLRLSEFVGQPRATDILSMSLAGARSRGEVLDHVLLLGPPGLGKTSLARILASEAGASLRSLAAPSVGRPGDLAAVLVSLRPGDLLFLDEIHRLPSACAETLYGAMEDFRLDVLAGDGATAAAISIPLPRFKLVGATTRPGMLPRPLRDRFQIDVALEPYAPADLAVIVARSAGLLGMDLADGVAAMVACRSRGTPRLANRLLRRLRDYAAHGGVATVTGPIAEKAFGFLGIDGSGLDARDRRYLACLADRGRPIGLGTLAAALGEDPGTLEEEVEPWLLANGLVDRTSQGRVPGPAKLRLSSACFGVATSDSHTFHAGSLHEVASGVVSCG